MSRIRRFLVHPQILMALVIVGLYVLVAGLAPVLAPQADPEAPSGFRVIGEYYDPVPKPPDENAVLGTSVGQNDVFHTLVWGTRSALRFGLVVAFCAAAIGTLVGAISGFSGKLVGGLILRITDTFLAFPPIAAVWLLRQVMNPDPFAGPTPVQQAFLDLKLDPVLLALVLFSWMPYARLIHAGITQLKRAEYVEAARAIGMRNRRVVRKHLLPNVIPPAVVLAARDVGAMVILESAFTYIGLGGNTEWGVLLVQSRDYVIGSAGNPFAYWWVFVPVTLALILFGVGWNLLGDGLNAALNPRISRLRPGWALRAKSRRSGPADWVEILTE